MSLALREENRLRVFKNRRRMFAPQGHQVTEGWGWLHNEELHNSQFSPRVIRILKSLAGKVRIEKRNVYRLLVGKPEGLRPLGNQT
jgi:hypothetical protein